MSPQWFVWCITNIHDRWMSNTEYEPWVVLHLVEEELWAVIVLWLHYLSIPRQWLLLYSKYLHSRFPLLQNYACVKSTIFVQFSNKGHQDLRFLSSQSLSSREFEDLELFQVYSNFLWRDFLVIAFDFSIFYKCQDYSGKIMGNYCVCLFSWKIWYWSPLFNHRGDPWIAFSLIDFKQSSCKLDQCLIKSECDASMRWWHEMS